MPTRYTPHAPRAERPEKYTNLCSPCGLDFASVPSFDAHRVGDDEYTYSEGLKMDPPREDGRRCLDLDEMKAAGWDQDSRGRWRAPGHPRDEGDLTLDQIVL